MSSECCERKVRPPLAPLLGHEDGGGSSASTDETGAPVEPPKVAAAAKPSEESLAAEWLGLVASV